MCIEDQSISLIMKNLPSPPTFLTNRDNVTCSPTKHSPQSKLFDVLYCGMLSVEVLDALLLLTLLSIDCKFLFARKGKRANVLLPLAHRSWKSQDNMEYLLDRMHSLKRYFHTLHASHCLLLFSLWVSKIWNINHYTRTNINNQDISYIYNKDLNIRTDLYRYNGISIAFVHLLRIEFTSQYRWVSISA